MDQLNPGVLTAQVSNCFVLDCGLLKGYPPPFSSAVKIISEFCKLSEGGTPLK